MKMIAIHPGNILKSEFLDPLGITPHRLSRELHVSAPRVNDIILERRGITADMALRLGRFFGTTENLWLNLQAEYDRRIAHNALPPTALVSITPYASQKTAFAVSTKTAPAGRPRKVSA
jgi:addiction module HigA family antidote